MVFKAIKTVTVDNYDFFGSTESNENCEYSVFATNLEGNGYEIYKIYNQRAVCENWIAQIKSQLMAGKTLTHAFWTNDILWQLCCLSYNLSVMMRKNDETPKKTIENQEHTTFLYWFIKVPANLVKTSRKTILKIYKNLHLNIF